MIGHHLPTMAITGLLNRCNPRFLIFARNLNSLAAFLLNEVHVAYHSLIL